MKKTSFAICITAALLLLQGCSEEKPITSAAAEETPAAMISEPVPTPAETPFEELIEIPPTLSELISPEDLAPYFEDFTSAVILLSDGVSLVALNEEQAQERHWPYSSFKIPSSLIALEEGVVSIEESLRQWDGIQYNRPELNQNQDLASAMKHSCVWYYKELAREIGEDAMQSRLNSIGYGNMDISGGIDEFWLGSTLLISPQEQLDFIIRLYNNDLPFSTENMEYVKSIMRQDAYPIELYGKTGSSGMGHGWFVGYAIIDESPYFVSAYIEGEDAGGPVARDKVAELLGELF